jgi:hypothetical protein
VVDKSSMANYANHHNLDLQESHRVAQVKELYNWSIPIHKNRNEELTEVSLETYFLQLPLPRR